MAEAANGSAGRGGCGCLGRGCLTGLLIVGLLAVALLVAPTLLRRAGLLGGDPERLYAAAPDRAAAATLNEVLEAGGIEGAQVMVIPIEGRTGQIAIVTLDGSSLVTDTEGPAEEALRDLLGNLSAANTQHDMRIERVALDFRGESGEPLLGLTAPQEAVEAYAAGQISRQDFLGQVDVDLTNLISEDEARQILEEIQQ